MNIIVAGPQGSGKGTQAKLLVRELDCQYFESGNILRQKAKESSPFGRKINEIINKKGKLVSGVIMGKILEEWLTRVKDSNGIIFDGFPRTLNQFLLLKKVSGKKGIKIDKVFYLTVSRETSLRRLLARRICPGCNLEYNLITKPPKQDGSCDVCGGKLEKRQDDKVEVIEERLNAYDRLTKPLLNFVRTLGILEEVDGERGVEEIFEDIMERLRK